MNAVLEAKRIIENLPGNSSWDDIMYQMYVRQKIEAGIRADNEGNAISDEELIKKFGLIDETYLD